MECALCLHIFLLYIERDGRRNVLLVFIYVSNPGDRDEYRQLNLTCSSPMACPSFQDAVPF